MYLTLDSFSGTSENPAFEPAEFPWAYGVVTLLIFGVGFGLVAAGHWVAARRRVLVWPPDRPDPDRCG